MPTIPIPSLKHITNQLNIPTIPNIIPPGGNTPNEVESSSLQSFLTSLNLGASLYEHPIYNNWDGNNIVENQINLLYNQMSHLSQE